MNTSKKLKIWTIITHFFIIIGAGHGIVTIGVFEFLFISHVITGNAYTTQFNTIFYNPLVILGLTALSGQALLIYSILGKIYRRKLIAHITAISFFWGGVAYFILAVKDDNYTHFGGFSALPLAACTVMIFFGKKQSDITDN